MACAGEIVKATPKLWILSVEVAKVAQQIGPSPNYGTNYTLFCGLAHVWVEPVKNSTVNRTFIKSWRARVETVKMAWGIYSLCTTKNAVWVEWKAEQLTE